MLLLVLAVAAQWGLPEAIFTSILAVLGLNYFFLPPILQFTIADPENWVALFVFLVTAGVASELSAQARRRAEEAVTGKNEISRLYELSRAMLMDEARDAVRVSVQKRGKSCSFGISRSMTRRTIRCTVRSTIPASRRPI